MDKVKVNTSLLRKIRRKRKIKYENRIFHNDWTKKYAFIERNNKPMCLICNIELAHNKTCNVKRHYETKHKQFSEEYPLCSNYRKNKIELLKTKNKNQQLNISSYSQESINTTEASFVIVWNIARGKHPYTDGEFVKQNISDVLSVLDPSNSKIQRLVSQIPISRHTTERRISEISIDVEQQLLNDLKNCEAFSLAVDESTDIQDKPQMAVFVRYVTSDVIVKEELLDLVELKDTTRGVDIKEALDKALLKANVPINKLVSVATDGASAMAGKHLGLIGLLKSDPKYPEFIPIHCVVHREHLAAKHFNFPIVFKSVLKIVNYIRANAKNHRQFRNFINELDLADEPSDVSFFCSVRWLSSSDVFYRFVELLEPIKCFLIEKEKTFEILDDINFVQDLLFLTDIMQHLKSLNLFLQGKEKNISDLAQTIFSFQKKIILFQKDLSLKKFNHFPQMKKMITSNPSIQYDDDKIESYLDKLKDLQKDFQKRFKDLHELKSSLGFIVNPFLINIISNGCPIPEKMLEDISQFEMELLDLQEDQNLLMLHKTITFMEFWKIAPEVKYPQLKKIAIKFISIFGSTYTCESLFSTMKFVKSKYRANLTNEHLSELLRTATTSLKPDFKKLTSKVMSISLIKVKN
ncbi:general transcription factor II-I repeat domain-containing protein 2A-like [Hydra vulgaris]|uniref:general transcription factor II-I repeat domain-containing protein 2A-like n=1 Tax=Hydra vulgaris TaxID=6087 RepID=UPI0032EA2ECA